jgi:endonuclease/exonuclease/phosphatase family metal-dependent hydrolase
MKYLLVCAWLSLVLAFGACQCGGNTKVDSPADRSALPDASVTILVCTANVQYFHTNIPQVVLKELDGLRQAEDDIVILALQETKAEHYQKIKQALPAYEVYDSHRQDEKELANTIAVFNKTQHKIKHTNITLPRYGPVPQRYAAIVEIPTINFKVANTHLFGGRFDDPTFFYFPKVRSEQMAVILSIQPTIVMGDFNVDSIQPTNLGKYWERILNKFLHAHIDNSDILKEEAMSNFIKYLSGVHVDLQQANYTSLLQREAVKTTARGNSVVDWIYINKNINYSVVNAGVVAGINKKLSDHNFVWARIVVKL